MNNQNEIPGAHLQLVHVLRNLCNHLFLKETHSLSRNRFLELSRLFTDDEMRGRMAKAAHFPFEIAVMGTMKAGKSTFINALLGTELLPSNIEASTARVIRIEDVDHMTAFEVRTHDESSVGVWLPADHETLTGLNEKPGDHWLEVRGDVPTVRNQGASLVLYDTPGPNNARDASHGDRAYEILKDGKFGLIIYLLNATQLGTDDDKQLLTQVHDTISTREGTKEIVFVLNRADEFDPEQGSTLLMAVEGAQRYLVEIGFQSPAILPVCSLAALLARIRSNNGKLTKREKHELKSLEEFAAVHPEYIGSACIAPESSCLGCADSAWKSLPGEAATVLEWSGIPRLERLIQWFVDSYGYPRVLIRVSEVLERSDCHELRRWLLATEIPSPAPQRSSIREDTQSRTSMP